MPLQTIIKQLASSAALERLEQFLEDGQALLTRKPKVETDEITEPEIRHILSRPVISEVPVTREELQIDAIITQQDDDKAAAERPRHIEDEEIESIATAVTSSSSEDVISIKTPRQELTPMETRQYKKTTAINSADVKRNVTVTIGREQMIHAIGLKEITR